MISDRSIYHYALIELEATTPHAIQTVGDITHDSLLFRDANGLPVIPATSLTGVLRSVYQTYFGEEKTNALFGFINQKSNANQPSWVHVTSALVHNSQNKAQEGILSQAQRQDPLLQSLFDEKPIVRQRVRLNSKGATVEHGKFDVTLAPAGVRYSAFIGYWSTGTDEDEACFSTLLNLLSSPYFRLGHNTRSGNGAFKVNAIYADRFALKNKEDRGRFQKRPRHRQNADQLPLWNGAQNVALLESDIQWTRLDLPLQAESGIRIGGGEVSLSEVDENGKSPDILPQSEWRVIWKDQKASIISAKQNVVLPASAIKGALAHRFAFHYRRLQRQFVNAIRETDQPLEDNEQLKGIQALFGFSDKQDACIGKLVMDDIYLSDPKIQRQMHNKIDRYTGGVIEGALFEEELLWQIPLDLSITLFHPTQLDEDIQAALKATLLDLQQGLLPIGAGGSRGNGALVIAENKTIKQEGYSFLNLEGETQ